MQLYFTTVSLPINSLVDSPDHPLAFPPTEHGAHSAFLDINAPHDRGGAIGFLCCKLAAQLLIDRPFDARSVGWGIGGRTTKSNVPSLICWPTPALRKLSTACGTGTSGEKRKNLRSSY